MSIIKKFNEFHKVNELFGFGKKKEKFKVGDIVYYTQNPWRLIYKIIEIAKHDVLLQDSHGSERRLDTKNMKLADEKGISHYNIEVRKWKEEQDEFEEKSYRERLAKLGTKIPKPSSKRNGIDIIKR